MPLNPASALLRSAKADLVIFIGAILTAMGLFLYLHWPFPSMLTFFTYPESLIPNPYSLITPSELNVICFFMKQIPDSTPLLCNRQFTKIIRRIISPMVSNLHSSFYNHHLTQLVQSQLAGCLISQLPDCRIA